MVQFGHDTLRGGLGNDTYLVDNAADIIEEIVGGGTTDSVRSTVSYTLSEEVERLTLLGAENINATGNTGNNILTGNSGNNILDGGTGNDSMAGGAGDDIYRQDSPGDVITESANAGTDTIETTLNSRTLGSNAENLTFIGSGDFTGTGNGADNVVIGGNGNDTLNGWTGNDVLIGGAGNDTFRFDRSLNATTNVDNLTDFTVAEDTIQLENLVFSRLVSPGTLSADLFFVEGSGAQGANDYIVYNAAMGQISYDSNGSGAGGRTLFATVAANLGLTSDDFIVA